MERGVLVWESKRLDSEAAKVGERTGWKGKAAKLR